jgi:hypothetical protein
MALHAGSAINSIDVLHAVVLLMWKGISAAPFNNTGDVVLLIAA